MKYIKIPHNFFDLEEVKMIESEDNRDELINILMKLIVKSKPTSSGDREYSANGIKLTLENLSVLLRHDADSLNYAFELFTEMNLIEHRIERIAIKTFWKPARDRNAPQYKKWRADVFNRDGYECKECGSAKELQAHHIIPWSETNTRKWLRFDVENGVTLCRSCHLKAHGGSWR